MTTCVHTFKCCGQRIALDVPSGAVHVLSELAFEMLQRIAPPLAPECPTSLRYELAKYESSDVSEAYDELYSLYKDGLLFSEDTEYKMPPSGVVKSMCLHVSHDCNMRCKYCFADAGDYNRSRKLMSLETGKKALDFLLEKSGKIRNLEVDMFGGEPLLNFDVVRELVAYGRQREQELGKKIAFTITTNGALLDDEAIDFINAEFSNVVLSIDGRKEVNDRMRTYVDGSGTYDTILPNFKKLIERRKEGDWYVRGTFTRENLDFASDVIALADEGFDQISVEPVVLDENDPLAIRREDLPKIFKEYDRLAREMIRRHREGKSINFFHFMVDLDEGPCVYKRCKGCGSGSEYVAVTPDGDIFPCHQFVEFMPMKMGNVLDGTFNRDLQMKFAGCNITTNSVCRDCWAKYYCGGGCAANNYKYKGAVETPYEITCELERKRVECALAIKAAIAQFEQESEN